MGGLKPRGGGSESALAEASGVSGSAATTNPSPTPRGARVIGADGMPSGPAAGVEPAGQRWVLEVSAPIEEAEAPDRLACPRSARCPHAARESPIAVAASQRLNP